MRGLMRAWIPLAAALSLAAYAGAAAQQMPSSQPQQFIVLRSDTLIVPYDSLTSDQAKCSISGNGNFATMRCLAPPGTAKASYHYVTALVVDQQGMAYGIACHQSLIDLWCKKFAVGSAIQGSADSGKEMFSIAEGQKSHEYQMLTSAFVGPLQPGQPVPSAKRGKTQAAPTASAAATPSSATQPAATTAAPVTPAPKAGNGEAPGTGESKTLGGAPGTCVAATASCVTFVSEPPNADIYVDGKFMGNTPSTLALPEGSHEIRVESGKFKPWTRTLASTAGSTVTIHATLEKK